MSDLVLDSQVFIPDDQIVTVGDKTFDLSEVPFEFSLRFYELIPIFQKLQDGAMITVEDYNSMFPIIYDLLKFYDESVEEKWLRKKIRMSTFAQILLPIFTCVFTDGKKNDGAEKVADPPQSS